MNTIIFHDRQAHLRRGKHSDVRQNASSFCGNIVTADRMLPRMEEALQRPTEYTMLQDGVLSRATEYWLRLRKHSDGRHSTRCYRMEYSHGRQRTGYKCGNTPTADRVHDAAGWNTLTADRGLATTAETFRWPTECFLSLRKHRNGRQSTWSILSHTKDKMAEKGWWHMNCL